MQANNRQIFDFWTYNKRRSKIIKSTCLRYKVLFNDGKYKILLCNYLNMNLLLSNKKNWI